MILDLLKGRYSARKFLDRPVSDEIIREMLEAARLAPSGGNEQAWAFGVVTDRTLIQKIASLSYYNEKWMTRAPLIVALCTRLTGSIATPDLRFPELAAAREEVLECIGMEEHQVKIPGTQMALVALEHGVQCTWVSHFRVKEVAKVLRLPARYLPTNLLVFGYPQGENPTESGRPRKRDLQDIVFYNTAENLPPADQVPHWRWD
jgi:nitroreductase